MRDEIEKPSSNNFTPEDDKRTRLTVQGGRIEVVRRSKRFRPRFLPLTVRSAGRGRILPGEKISQHVHDYVKLFWCCSGSGVVVVKGAKRILHQNQVMIFLPGERQIAYAEETDWEICFLTIDPETQSDFLKGFGLEEGGIFSAGPAPQATFRSLITALKNPSPAGAAHASVICYDIFSQIRNTRATPYLDPLVSAAISIFDEEWSNAGIGIDVVAIRLNTHRSSLSRRFRAAVGIPPSDYLNSLRMQHALTLIEYTEAPIGEIARSCGYQDSSYFSRMFLRINGVTARKHRKLFQSTNLGAETVNQGINIASAQSIGLRI